MTDFNPTQSGSFEGVHITGTLRHAILSGDVDPARAAKIVIGRLERNIGDSALALATGIAKKLPEPIQTDFLNGVQTASANNQFHHQSDTGVQHV